MTRSAGDHGVEEGLNGPEPTLSNDEQTALATALGLPASADQAEILGAITALREHAAATELLERVALLSLARIREQLGLPEAASPLDCAAKLAGSVPSGCARAAIVAVQLAETRDALRRAEVREIMRDALSV